MASFRSTVCMGVLGCTLALVTLGFSEHAANAQAAPARAEAKPDLGEPEAVAKERARLLFEKGVTAYREGRFYDAVDIFLETNRLYPDPKFSYNIGKAFEGMGNQPSALRYYREYLRRLPDASDAHDVDGHVHQLEQALSQKGVQQLTVITVPEGATLKLDGQAVGITPWTGESFAGKHRLVLEASGYKRMENVIEIDPQQARDFDFDLVKEPEKPPAALACVPPKLEPKVSVFTMSTLGTGLALLGTALIAEAVSSGSSSGISRTSAFFTGAGTGVSLVGGVMLYFDLYPGSAGAASAPVTWSTSGLQHGMSQ